MPFDGTTTQSAEVASLLRGARQWIARERHWGKREMRSFGLYGFRYCAVGAVAREAAASDLADIFASHPTGRAAVYLLDRAAERRGHCGAIAFNDYWATTHADVLALFDEAIAAAEGR